MLWWLVGMWLASGLTIPLLWLLSVAGRRLFFRLPNAMPATAPPAPRSKRMPAKPRRTRIGRFSLAGLVAIGALVLMFVGSFSDPITRLQELPSVLTPAPAPASLAAMPPSSGEVDQALSAEPADDNLSEVSLNDPPSRADTATLLVAAEQLPATPPSFPTPTDATRNPRHGRAHALSAKAAQNGGVIGTYYTRSVHGTWLFPPNPNGN